MKYKKYIKYITLITDGSFEYEKIIVSYPTQTILFNLEEGIVSIFLYVKIGKNFRWIDSRSYFIDLEEFK